MAAMNDTYVKRLVIKESCPYIKIITIKKYVLYYIILDIFINTNVHTIYNSLA